LTPGGEQDGVAIFGAAGVGKTRLAREAAAAAAARGWQVRHIAATGAARTIPMGVFQQWIDAPATNPLGLVAHVIDAIATTDDLSRVVVVVDDAHLLDDVSAFTLAQLVQRRTASVIATIRAGEPVAAEVTALWKDRALVRLDLQPLSRDETTALMTAVLGGPLAANTTKRIWDITQGNALYLKQLVDRETQGQRLAFDGKRWVWVDPAGLPPSLFDIVGAVGAR
jgi:type II secretory pathway predicted ATPase ExeA